MKLLKLIILFVSTYILIACTTIIGPYVTDISTKGDGLTIDKCMVKYTTYFIQRLRFISKGDCSTSFIDLERSD